MEFLKYVSEDTKEEILKEWFFSSDKKKEKPKKQHKISRNEYPKKAIAEIKRLLNTPEYKEAKKYVKLQLDQATYKNFISDESSDNWCEIGVIEIPNFHDEDLYWRISKKATKAIDTAHKNLGDDLYEISYEEDVIEIYDNEY